jgi:hypothetical protein
VTATRSAQLPGQLVTDTDQFEQQCVQMEFAMSKFTIGDRVNKATDANQGGVPDR